MKKVAVLFFCLILAISSSAQVADTLNQTSSSDISTFGIIASIWIAISVIYVIYLAIKAIFFPKKEIKLTEEERNKLIEYLKDKTLPFFRIKGTTFYDVKKPGGYIAELVPESNNPKDPYAVAVVHSTLGIIGHLPKGNEHVYRKAKKQKIYGAVEIGISREGYTYGKFWLDPSIFADEEIAQMIHVEINDRY